MKELKEYQLNAINQLMKFTEMFLDTPKNETIVFQSPTGSGKTVTMARYILELVEESDEDLCFLWISIGKGDLQIQSYKSVRKEIGDSIECSLLENEFFGSREIINQNEIVFVNWEKIRTKDRKTNEFKNTLMRDWEQNNFPTILNNTRATRKIILIIDESHSSATTERAMEIRDEIISPSLTIEMSATPVFTSENINARVFVEPTDVINEGMIKKEIIINDKIAETIEKEKEEKTSELLVLESAYSKEEELKRRYKKLYDNGETTKLITPLTLIQIPNSNYGEEKRITIENFLKNKGITSDNGKLAVWLNDDKINNSFEELNANDSKVEYLIFKMAIDTGWDCPRAQVLLKFREIDSIVFEIQTVGRILRMPEAKHYSDEMLNRAFVYSNIKSIAIKKEVYNPNIIKSCSSKVKEEYRMIDTEEIDKIEPTEKKSVMTLRSYYRKRIDYGDITSSFYKVYEREFCECFKIPESSEIVTTAEAAANEERMKKMGVNYKYRKKESILSDAHIESEKVDREIEFAQRSSLVDIMMSDSDLQNDFERVIQNNLNGFAPVRSIPTVKTAIINAFVKYLHLKPQNKGIILMQNIVVNNSELFGRIISTATQKYKPIHEYEVTQKHNIEINKEWHIPLDKNYNPNTNTKIESKLSIHQPLYMETKNGKVDELEVGFVNYLDTHEESIEYFWKNGSEHMNTNFGICKRDGSTFQPDFLIQFKDGRIGIFDTKAGNGHNESDNEAKSNALQQYIADERKIGRNLIGGLVIENNGTYYYYDRTEYKTYREDSKQWKGFNELFK